MKYPLPLALLLSLSGCGGVSDAPSDNLAQPAFHMNAAELQPSDRERPHHAHDRTTTYTLSARASRIRTNRLTVPELESAMTDPLTTVTPQATTTIAVFRPSQIRAAYQLPTMPTGLPGTLAQQAGMGAGQTIYIVDAYHDPTIIHDLAQFSTTYGLPQCATVTVPASSRLPLAPATVASGCTILQVYASALGGMMTNTMPGVSSGWQGETTLDVEWAHAMAPLARIVLIEAQNSSQSALMSAVSLANGMGPGVVSMSWGLPEYSSSAAQDSVFRGSGMTYTAAAGDAGAQVLWPAVSSLVLAVGGTTLTYSGVGARSESAWSGSGGGVSRSVSRPTYQNVLPGAVTPSFRSVSDVSMVADPLSGVYVVMTPIGSNSTRTYSFGGTSLGSPVWAGILAVNAATRVINLRPTMPTVHTTIYTRVAQNASQYAASFGDIRSGVNGSCVSCRATLGYDTPTGLGTPNVTALINQLLIYQ